MPTGNSSIYTGEFPSVRLPALNVMARGVDGLGVTYVNATC